MEARRGERVKVFGVGFQRTGTTSLAVALNALGIKTLQFPKELYNDIDNDNNTATDKEEKDLQTQAKEEVAKVVKNATTAWSGFWQNEYDDINGTQDAARAADVVTQTETEVKKEE